MKLWHLAGPALFAVCLSAQEVKLERLGSYATGVFNRGAAEIAAHDSISQRLFVVNGDSRTIDILDIRTPSRPALVSRVNIPEVWGNSANSVAVYGGVVAAAIEAVDRQRPGSVIFMDSDGRILGGVKVGAVPDMLTFTKDGRYVLVANEGEPSANYATDPDGSVSVIDIRAGVQNASQTDVRTVGFSSYNSTSIGREIRVYGPRATVAQDVEPEYIAVSPDNRTAFVTLQENNAIAEIDIERALVTRIMPLGYKDHSRAGSGLDASDRDNRINIQTWPVLGVYMSRMALRLSLPAEPPT